MQASYILIAILLTTYYLNGKDNVAYRRIILLYQSTALKSWMPLLEQAVLLALVASEILPDFLKRASRESSVLEIII